MSEPPRKIADAEAPPSPVDVPNITQPPAPIFFNEPPSKTSWIEKNIPHFFTLVINFINLMFGVFYLKDCPVERMIPIFLIVHGCFGLTADLVGFARRAYTSNAEGEEKPGHPIEFIIYLFLFAWSIAGSVYIYRVKAKVNTEDSEDPNYCHETLYWDAFWFVTIMNGLFAFIIVFVCIGMIHEYSGKGNKEEKPTT